MQVPAARGAVAFVAVEHEVDVDVLIRWPMALEVVEEYRPVGLQSVELEVPQWERKAVIDADQQRFRTAELVDQPLGDLASCPVFARRRRRRNFGRGRVTLGLEDPQSR